MRSGEEVLNCFDVNNFMDEEYMQRRAVHVSLADYSTAFVTVLGYTTTYKLCSLIIKSFLSVVVAAKSRFYRPGANIIARKMLHAQNSTDHRNCL